MSTGSEGVDIRHSNKKQDLRDECQIWVLKVETNNGADATEDGLMQSALFSKLESSCLAPQWITEEECMKVAKRKNEIFVLPHFSGQVFEHLSELRCRTYGSLAVLSCLNARERLPKWTHPIESVILRNAVICFTGFDYAVREAQTVLIMKMGGIVSRDFNAEVTHLVATEHNNSSKKYNAAVQRSVPVMSIEWLQKAWEATCKFSEVRFTDSDIVEMYRLKLFSGCLMTCSGVSLQERLLLGQLIEENGGQFRGDMERYKCTHLLTDKNSGEKYRKAREWGWDTIKIVRLAWLAECIEKGHLIPENLYEPKVPIKYSTPKSSLSASPACLEFSAIPRHKSQNCDSWVHNGTTINSALSGVTADDLVVGTAVLSDKNALSEKRTLKKSLSARLINDTGNVNLLPDFDISRLECDGDFLEGCRLYFYGMDKAVLAKWKRLASSMGASISNVLNETITHVVLGVLSNGSKVVSELSDVPASCVIVSCEWLVECAKANKLLATSNFTVTLENRKDYSAGDRTLKKALPMLNDRVVANDSKTGAFAVSQRVVNRLVPSSDAVPTTSSVSQNLANISSSSRIQQPKNDFIVNPSDSSGNQLFDSPSVFLNPKKNFIPRFDLRKAYERVGDLQSFEQSNCSECSDWSESAVGKVLNEAILKTAANADNDDEVSGHVGVAERRDVAHTPQHTKTSSYSPKDREKLAVENNQIAVSNEDKKRMIERCLANLATYEYENPPETSTVKSRKRVTSRLRSTVDEPLAKREVENVTYATSMCDSHESITEGGNIGWAEANQPSVSVRCTNHEPPNCCSNSPDEDYSRAAAREKKIPLNFNLNEEVIFIEKQNSTITSFLSNKNVGEPVGVMSSALRNSSKVIASSGHPTAEASNASSSIVGQGKFSKRVENHQNLSVQDGVNAPDARGVASSSMKPEMVFLLSSLEESKREKYATIITRFGGELCLEFNDKVRFLVCGDIIRNEKLLTSIACGLFILVPEFLDESEIAGHWLQPELYEWGSPQCVAKHKFTNKKAENLALACRRWRLKIGETDPKRKAFHDWKAVLYCSRRRSVDIGRIISFGGGFCVLRDDVKGPDGFTHALVEKSKYWNDKEITELAKKRVKCFNIDYIANFLSVENIVEDDYLHQDYLKRLVNV